jgi:hypothetical protein
MFIVVIARANVRRLGSSRFVKNCDVKKDNLLLLFVIKTRAVVLVVKVIVGDMMHTSNNRKAVM